MLPNSGQTQQFCAKDELQCLACTLEYSASCSFKKNHANKRGLVLIQLKKMRMEKKGSNPMETHQNYLKI